MKNYKGIRLDFFGLIDEIGNYITLDGKNRLHNINYVKYIHRISEIEDLPDAEIIYLAKQYIFLKNVVDAHNNKLENQKIKV